jgi:hypothetical protein
MPQTDWSGWTDQEWLDNANAYHASRLSADAWAALTAEKRGKALTSARTYLAKWVSHVNYPIAVYEQAAWLTTESAENAINDYSSVSV